LKRRAAIAASGSALVIALVMIAAFRGKAAADDIPTYRVKAAPFRRRVTTDGTLKAVNATPISAPSEAAQGCVDRHGWVAGQERRRHRPLRSNGVRERARHRKRRSRHGGEQAEESGYRRFDDAHEPEARRQAG
jgi:hypothetical protein